MHALVTVLHCLLYGIVAGVGIYYLLEFLSPKDSSDDSSRGIGGKPPKRRKGLKPAKLEEEDEEAYDGRGERRIFPRTEWYGGFDK